MPPRALGWSPRRLRGCHHVPLALPWLVTPPPQRSEAAPPPLTFSAFGTRRGEAQRSNDSHQLSGSLAAAAFAPFDPCDPLDPFAPFAPVAPFAFAPFAPFAAPFVVPMVPLAATSSSPVRAMKSRMSVEMLLYECLFTYSRMSAYET